MLLGARTAAWGGGGSSAKIPVIKINPNAGFKTGITMNDGDYIQANLMIESQPTGATALFGTCSNFWGYVGAYLMNTSGTRTGWAIAYQGLVIQGKTLSENEWHFVQIGHVSAIDDLISTTTKTLVAGLMPCCGYAGNASGGVTRASTVVAHYKDFAVYDEGGNLRAKLIPAKDGNGVSCMKDQDGNFVYKTGGGAVEYYEIDAE